MFSNECDTKMFGNVGQELSKEGDIGIFRNIQMFGNE